jgi:hypothetical protein
VTLAAAYSALALAGLALVELLSAGRFSENLFGLSASAFEEPFPALVAGAARKLVSLSETGADATWLLAPVALTGVLLAVRRRQLSVYELSLLLAIAVTAVIMADAGAGDSHLLDVHVLLVVVVAEVWRQHVAAATEERASLVAPLIAMTVLLAIVGSYATQLAEKTRVAARVALGREENRFALEELRRVVPPNASILSEDPTVPIVLGKRPVVLDAFMLARIGRSHPEWVEMLERRLDAKEFDRVVLFHRPGFVLDGDNPFWRDTHFGAGVVEAIARNYRSAHVASGYDILVPRRAPPA